MDKSKQISHQATDSDITVKYWGNIAIAVLGILATVTLLRSVLQFPESTIFYLAIVFYVLAILTGMAVILLTIRGHQKSGAQIAFYTTVALFASGPFFYAGRALVASLSLLMVSAITISQLLPKESRRRSIVIVGATVLVMWVIEWMNPPWRLLPGTANNVGIGASILFALILAGIIVRQAWSGNIRVKFVMSFIGISLISIAIVAIVNDYNSRSNLTASSGTAIKSVADSKAAAIGDALLKETHTLQSLSLSNLLQDQALQINAAYGPNQTDNINNIQQLDEQWRAADAANNNYHPLVRTVLHNDLSSELREYSETFPENVEVFVTDKYGAVFASTNRTSDYYQADEEWWQTVYNNGQGAFYIGQPEFDQSSKTFAVIMAIPVYAHGTQEIQGILRTTINMDSILSILRQDILNSTGDTQLYLPNGQMIDPENANGTRPADTNALNRLPALLSNKSFDTFTLDGVPSVVSAAHITSEDAEIEAALKNLDWSLVVSQSQADNLAPVNAQTQSTAIVALIILSLSGLLAVFLARLLSNPIVRLTSLAEQVAAGNTAVQAAVESTDEIGKLAGAFNSMTSQLRELIGSLEQRVAARTRNLELAAHVGRAVSQVRDLDVMLQDACELILKEFNLYYVQVYLISADNTSLHLEAGTGEVGAQLVKREHRLPFDVNSINGRAAVEKHSVMISDTARSATFRQNPLLPETRGEMAVPLIVADKVVGVLDMQSREAGALNDEILPAFEALAGQLAVAIQNASLLKEANEARAEVEKQARRLVRQNWDEHLDAVHTPEQIGFKFDQKEVVPLVGPYESNVPENVITSSISVTGEPVGSLAVKIDDFSRRDQAPELVSAVAQRMAQQIENLRLLESAERYRQKAELVVRRTTLEGWRQFMDTRTEGRLAFRFDTREVQPLSQDTKVASVTFPIKTRDQAIGKLSILDLEEQDNTSLEIVDSVVERLADHIESLRQYDQTQNARVQSEKLFQVSSQLTQATDMQELVSAVVSTLDIPAVNRALLITFQYGESGEPEQLTIIGNWWNGTGHEVTAVGTRYPREVMRVMSMFISPTPVFFNDVFNDRRVDPTTMEQVAKRLNLRSVAVLPLYSANQQIGALVLEGEEPHKFTQEEIRLFTSLAPQLATIIENRRQYEETQLARAQSEKLFQASSQLTQVADLQQLVKVVAETIQIPLVNRIVLDLFNYSAAGDLESMDVAATWWNETGHEATPIGTHYPIQMLHVMKLFLSRTPVIFSDALTDERFDQSARQIAQNLAVRSGAVLPLQAGSRQIGILFLQAEEPHTFTPEETRLFEALSPQIATVLENRRQYESAQRQAEREATLNAINQKIQSATSVEAVLQIAARELGRALDASKAVAQLGVFKRNAGNGHHSQS